MTLSMPNTRKLPAWLERFTSRPVLIVHPEPQRPAPSRCGCGRFCKSEAPDITDKLVSELIARDGHVPEYFAQRGQGGVQ